MFTLQLLYYAEAYTSFHLLYTKYNNFNVNIIYVYIKVIVFCSCVMMLDKSKSYDILMQYQLEIFNYTLA